MQKLTKTSVCLACLSLAPWLVFVAACGEDPEKLLIRDEIPGKRSPEFELPIPGPDAAGGSTSREIENSKPNDNGSTSDSPLETAKPVEPAKPLEGGTLQARMDKIRSMLPAGDRTSDPVQGFFEALEFSTIAGGFPCLQAAYKSSPMRIVSEPGGTEMDGRKVELDYDQTATLHVILAGSGRDGLVAEFDSKYLGEGWIRSKKEWMTGRADPSDLEKVTVDASVIKFTKADTNVYVCGHGDLVLYAVEKNGATITGSGGQGTDFGAQLIVRYTTRDQSGR